MTWLRGRLMCCRPLEPEPGNTGGGKKMKQQTEPTKSNNIFSTKILAEIIVFVAMAGALALVSHSFFVMPQGGTINLGMVPIFWLALRRGPKIGIFAGAVLGVVDLAIEPFVVNPAQFILDYPLAFACLGLAGFFRKLKSCWSGYRCSRRRYSALHVSLYFRRNLFSPVRATRHEPNRLLRNIQRNLHGAKHYNLCIRNLPTAKKQDSKHLHVRFKETWENCPTRN